MRQLVNVPNPNPNSKQARVMALTLDNITATTALGETVVLDETTIHFDHMQTCQTHKLS